MANDQVVLTLDIGGDSGDALNATDAIAAALEHLNETLSKSQGATEGASESGSKLSGVMGDLTGSLRSLNPEMGNLASVSQEVIGGASAGFMGIAGAAALAGGTMIELGMHGGELLTQLNQMAAVTGLTVERVDFWAKAMEDAGGSMSTLSRASILLQNSIEGINNAQEKGNDLNLKQRDVLNLLGGSIKDENGELLSSGEALEKLIPRLAGITDAQERSRLGIEAFGRSWGTVAPLVANYNEVTAAAERQTSRLAQVLGTDSASAMIAYNTRLTDMKTSMEVLEIEALPPLLKLLDGIDNALQHLVDFGTITVKIVTDISTTGSGIGARLLSSIFGASMGALPGGALSGQLVESGLSWLFGGPDSGNNFTPTDLSRHLSTGAGDINFGNVIRQQDADAKRLAAENAPLFGPGYGPEFTASLQRADAQTKSDQAKAEAQQKKDLAEAEKHLAEIQGALKDGTLSYADALKLQLTPAQAAAYEVTAAVSTRLDLYNDAMFQQAKAIAGVSAALQQGGDALDLFGEHLASVALKANQDALGSVLGQPTQEMARLNLQRAEAVQRLDSNAAPGVRANIQRDIDVIDARIRAETDHVAILKAQGEVANHLLLTDHQRDVISGDLIKHISEETTLVGKLDSALDPFNQSIGAAGRASMALAAALHAAAQAAGGSNTSGLPPGAANQFQSFAGSG